MKKYFSFVFVFVLLGSALFFNNAKAVVLLGINDLTCTPDITSGAIWIRWTPPAGVSASEAASAYQFKYVQGNTIDFDNATTYNQTWLSGNAGVVKQELAVGFNIGTQFTFAMKAQDGSDNWFNVSNATTCVSPRSNNTDSTPPTTHITYPAYNSSIVVGQPITIKGISKDNGGSSVKQIEVSLDNGVTWNFANPVSNEDGSLLWQYVWQSPDIGSYIIKARATDWMNNAEVSSLGIPINVVSEIATPTPTPTPEISCKNTWWFDNDRRVCSEKQFCGMYMYNGLQTFETRVACQTALDASSGGLSGGVIPGNAESIRAQIASLQAQLIQLLQQLLQLLRLK